MITGLLPKDGVSFVEGTAIEFSVTWEDPNGGDVTVKWWLEGLLLDEKAAFNISILPIGEHNLSVILNDAHHEVTRYVMIKIVKAPDEPVDPEPTEEPLVPKVDDDILDTMWIIAVIAVIAVTSMSIYVWKYKQKDSQDGR
jgi:hypothetical protein